ncbi:hypothetical protein ABZ848_23655 [Streptomyces sp. NPDC047081]|uniref:hypothetical protein n=1 Tax=Streptomyces sp. NPDC047081 TaxID=3154706 RepID=UPI0034005C4C
MTEPGRVAVTRHYFLADLLDMRPDRRGGPELGDPDIGTFEPTRVPLRGSVLSSLGLQTPQLAEYVLEHVDAWRTR